MSFVFACYLGTTQDTAREFQLILKVEALQGIDYNQNKNNSQKMPKSEKRFNSIFLKNNLFTEFFKKSPHDVFGGGKMEQKCIKIFPFLRSIRLTSAPLKHPLFSLLFFTSACHSKYQNEHEPRKNRFPFLQSRIVCEVERNSTQGNKTRKSVAFFPFL